MENQDLDLIGQTVGNLPYKIGIVDKDGNVTNQFVAKASTNRIDIPQSSLGAGGSYGLPSTINLFSGSAVGNILLSGPSANYDNVQDGLLITLSNQTLGVPDSGFQKRMDLSSIGLKGIKIPKEKLVVNSSFDISDQLPQCSGKAVQGQEYDVSNQIWSNDNLSNDFIIKGFGGTTINVLPNATLSINLTVSVNKNPSVSAGDDYNVLQIPVIQVNDYKN